jgi:hypothetical protein
MLLSTVYTATVQGSVVRAETCESCGETFSYLLSRGGSGSDTAFVFASEARKRASEKAQADLANKLENDHDDVPCPACGWHQVRAVTHVRSNSYPGMKNLAAAFFILSGIILGIMLGILGFILAGENPEWPSGSTVLECTAAVLIIAAPGLLLRGIRTVLLLAYRPNG